MELKTLNDLYGVIEKERNELMDDWVSVQKLKAEAVKWVKECEKCSEHDMRHDWAIFIKHFFNLAQEDLK